VQILVIEARYHPAIADFLADGATAALEKGGAQFTRVAVPGVLELPAAVAMAAQAEEPFDGYVALGTVIGGETVHDTIFREATHGLVQLGLGGLAIGNGVVMAGDEVSALTLARNSDAGGDAARACLALVMLRDRIGYLR